MSQTNVGSIGISLDLEVSSRLEKQIGSISENIAGKLKTNIEKSVTKTDLSKSFGKSFNSITKKSAEIGSKIGKNIADGISNAAKKASASLNGVNHKQPTSTPAQSIGAPTKAFKDISKDDLSIKRDNSIAMQENINAQIESLRAKLKQLQNINVDGSLSDDLLKIESRMISLTDKSDRLTVDIRQLDAAIDGFDTKEITSEGAKVSSSIDKIDRAAKRATGSLRSVGSASTKAQRPLINMRSIGASLARNFLGLQLLITLVGQGMRKLAQGFWNALKSNEQFNSSLEQIKSNLATAFQPILQAIMPAINSLMSGLSKMTAYLATFISLLAGKSVKASNASAKAMSKASKEANRLVAGFDQLNDITESSSDNASGGISPVNIDDAEIGKVQKFMDKVKGIIDKTFKSGPLKAFGGMFETIFTQIDKSFEKVADSMGASKKETLLWFAAFGISAPIVKKLFEAMLPNLIKMFDTLKTLITNIFNDISDALTEFIPKVTDQYIIFVDNVSKTFEPFAEFISRVWSEMAQILLDVWNKYGKDILKGIGDFIVGVMDTFNKIWTHIINPIIKPALEMLVKLWDEHLKGLITQIADFVGYAITEALKFYNNFIKPIIDWLVVTLGPIFKKIFDGIFTNVGNTLGKVTGVVSNVISTIKGVFSGLMTFLEGVFTGNWRKVFEGLGQIIKSVFDGIINMVKPMFNWIIDGINGFIRSANQVKVPKWIPLVGGKSISIPEIPRLATGAALTQPTLNIAGEYPGAKSNPEIVSPQNIMAETFRSVLREFMEAFMSTGNVSEQSINLIVNIGGRKILQEIIQLADEYKKQTGKELNFSV